jgi:hypothetical protein
MKALMEGHGEKADLRSERVRLAARRRSLTARVSFDQDLSQGLLELERVETKEAMEKMLSDRCLLT